MGFSINYSFGLRTILEEHDQDQFDLLDESGNPLQDEAGSNLLAENAPE